MARPGARLRFGPGSAGTEESKMPDMSSTTRRPLRIAFAMLALALAVAQASDAATPTAGVQACPPPPVIAAPALHFPPAPPQILACVGSAPITGAVFTHWATIAERAGSQRHKPTEASVAKEVMSFLIAGDWQLAEVQALGLHISAAEVRRHFDRIRAQQFPKGREFQKFLRSSGQTVADLLFRVRLQLASTRLERHALAAQHSPKQKALALGRFLAAFKQRWQAQTYCSATYAVSDCGHTF
jgi:hypothetical protein